MGGGSVCVRKEARQEDWKERKAREVRWVAVSQQVGSSDISHNSDPTYAVAIMHAW